MKKDEIDRKIEQAEDEGEKLEDKVEDAEKIRRKILKIMKKKKLKK